MAKNGKTNGHNRGALRTYKSYLFRAKDPVIDELRTIAQDHNGGKLSSKLLRQIEDDGGPSAGCLQAWWYGKTKRPNNATVEAAGRAMGRKRVWVSHRPNH